MPEPLVLKLNKAIHAALSSPEVKNRIMSLSIEPWSTSPKDFDTFLHKEVERNMALAKKAGINPE